MSEANDPTPPTPTPAPQPVRPLPTADVASTTTIAPQSPAPLDYDRTPNHVTRGQFRILLVLLFINTAALVGYLWAPNGMKEARQAWTDYKTRRAKAEQAERIKESRLKRIADFQSGLPVLATLRLPTTHPVYTEDVAEAAALLASDPEYETVPLSRNFGDSGGWQAAVGRRRPVELAPLAGLLSSSSTRSEGRIFTALMHERQNPAGETRLLWCDLDAGQAIHHAHTRLSYVTAQRTLRVRLIDPGSPEDAPSILHTVMTEFNQSEAERAVVQKGEPVKTPQVFRLLAGVPHDTDPSQAIIPYQISGGDGAFIVRISADDRLVVEPTGGRIVERSAARVSNTTTKISTAQTWVPSLPPAQPAKSIQSPQAGGPSDG